VLLNFAHGPLQDVRLRRAFSLALDRRALATAFHGALQTALIPAGIPGWVEVAPQKVRTNLARARALLGGRSITLDMVIPPDFPELARVAEQVRRDLARIGVTVDVRTDAEGVPMASDPAAGIDLLPLGWAMDFPDPGNAVTDALEVVAHGIWRAGDGTPAWLRMAVAASRVTGPERARVFRALDRRLSHLDVPMIPFASQLGRPVFFSDRVGCRRLLPLWDGLPDLTTLCLHGKA
jgi:ABC-type transport system substrate-binding protein